MQIILASTSKNRNELMQLAGIPFVLEPSAFDESSVATQVPQERVVELALKKAQMVAEKFPYDVVIGADTIGVFNGTILEKPKYKTDAFERLKKLSGNVHTMLTGYAVIHKSAQKQYTGLSETYVTFRTLEDEEILNYVNDNLVTTWAAGYSPLNTTAIRFIEKIKGSLSGFSHGIPLELVVPILREEGAL